ncbi:hypothetical protein Acy02nite_17010 [Actinoplanes cyaneus]|uniref:Uncharacterized protein n=1 Tax=Actinoplanes cyaneus TaxID=52696 RepID=A0A919IKW3_9ACTN|nr:hypothetical protein [Actinoplanes cyaneus]MCW2142023.1 hypothetical protein [Actinoplanes cyaneus]GID63820.1 hypothetical protein Acy02nite_17010 [Actinoplanes cyaneus]
MDDLNRMLAETLHDAAGAAPSEAGLLGSVHDRSRRYRRRRLVTVTAVSAAAAVVVAGIPVVTMLATRPRPDLPPAASRPAVTATPSGPAASPSPAASSRPPNRPSSAPPSAHTSSTAGAVTLSKGWTAPVFPYTLPATDGLSAPVASMDDGDPVAFFEATETRHHADVTVTVSASEPVFTTTAARTPEQVRGHAGTLRTVDVAPAKQLILYWKESSGRWIQVATDDTYTPDQVVALAESMTAAAVAVAPPFDLELSPGGLATTTVTASRMVFRSPAGGEFSTVLRKRQQLAGVNRKVGGRDAVLTRRPGQVTLSVDVPDWDATLQITVGGGLTVSDTDLLRYAEGVHVLNRSDPE